MKFKAKILKSIGDYVVRINVSKEEIPRVVKMLEKAGFEVVDKSRVDY